ncbi:hypothetical protein ACH42_17110 [Endozoicomonas sp. (ex Bugula neritina AB1)]|nr:hypothetical protein ACH42_17110 [Endozoicomonas sp. (ex Bugula neritina AB1)]
MECFNTQAAEDHAKREGEYEARLEYLEPIIANIYDRVKKHIEADPVLIEFAEKYCDELDDFIMEVAKEQMKVEGY